MSFPQEVVTHIAYLLLKWHAISRWDHILLTNLSTLEATERIGYSFVASWTAFKLHFKLHSISQWSAPEFYLSEFSRFNDYLSRTPWHRKIICTTVDVQLFSECMEYRVLWSFPNNVELDSRLLLMAFAGVYAALFVRKIKHYTEQRFCFCLVVFETRTNGWNVCSCSEQCAKNCLNDVCGLLEEGSMNLWNESLKFFW